MEWAIGGEKTSTVEKVNISLYPDSSQYRLIMSNYDFVKVFNKSKRFEEVQKWIDDNIICSEGTIERLKEKFKS